MSQVLDIHYHLSWSPQALGSWVQTIMWEVSFLSFGMTWGCVGETCSLFSRHKGLPYRPGIEHQAGFGLSKCRLPAAVRSEWIAGILLSFAGKTTKKKTLGFVASCNEM